MAKWLIGIQPTGFAAGRRWSLLPIVPLGLVTTSAGWWRERMVTVSVETRLGIRVNRGQSATVQFANSA